MTSKKGLAEGVPSRSATSALGAVSALLLCRFNSNVTRRRNCGDGDPAVATLTVEVRRAAIRCH